MKLDQLFEAESKANIARRIIRQVTSRAEFMQQANEAGITSPHTRQLYFSKFRSELGQGVEGFTPPAQASRSKRIKLKWRVQEAPTGRYRSFDRRGWPSADYPDGRPAVSITSQDEYIPRKVKTGDHAELILRVADYSVASPDKGSFQWKQLKRRFTTLDELKAAVPEILAGSLNYMVPKEYRSGKAEAVSVQKQITDEDLLKAVGDILNAMRQQIRFRSRIDEPEMQGKNAIAGIRDWGLWENPQDAHDEEDYDWQRLSDRSRQTLDEMLERFSKKYPQIQFEYSTEEKNWIMIYARPK